MFVWGFVVVVVVVVFFWGGGIFLFFFFRFTSRSRIFHSFIDIKIT